MAATELLGLGHARQQRFVLAAQVEDLAAPGERVAEVERVVAAPRVRIVGGVGAHRGVGPAEHPQGRSHEDADRGARVGVDEVGDVAVAFLVVKPEHALAVRHRLGERAAVEVRDTGGAVAHQQQVGVAALRAGLEHLLDPAERLVDAALRQHIDPQAPVDRHQRVVAAERARQRQRRVQAAPDLGRLPAVERERSGAERGAQVELGRVALGRVRQRLDQRHAACEVRHRLLVREPPDRAHAGQVPVVQRRRVLAGRGEVLREQFGLGLDRRREVVGQHLCDLRVQRLAPRLQQRVVGGVAQQRVLEGVGRLRRQAAPEREAGFDQLVQRGLERLGRVRRQRLDQFVAELAADRGADLGDLLDRRVAVEPRHQRVAQRRGDGHAARRADVVEALADEPQLARLEDRASQLLDVQRHAVGLREDALEQVVRQRLAAGEPRHQRAALRARQLRQVERGDVAVPPPDRHELGPVRQHDQERDRAHPVDQQVEHLDRRRVGPVQVFEQHHARLAAGRGLGDVNQRAQRLALVALRRHRQRAVARLGVDREHRGDVAHVGERPAVLADDQRFELVEARLGGLVARELESALEVVDARPVGAVQVVRRALHAHRARALALQALAQRAEDAALADARLAGEQHHLALAVLRQRPALEQQPDLLLAPDQRREAPLRGRVEAARRLADADDAQRLGRLGDALERDPAERLVLEAAAGQPLHHGADGDLPGLRDALQSRGQVHRLADRALLARRDHHQPRGDADAHREPARVGHVQRGERGDDVERGQHGALGLGLVRHRVAEERDDAVAEALEHEAFVARDAGRARVFVAPQHALQHLGVEACGEFGEANHVAEQHRQLAPLAVAAHARDTGWAADGRRRCRDRQRLQQLAAMPEQHAELCQVGLGQQAQRVNVVNTVRGEALGILRQPEGAEPGDERLSRHGGAHVRRAAGRGGRARASKTQR